MLPPCGATLLLGRLYFLGKSPGWVLEPFRLLTLSHVNRLAESAILDDEFRDCWSGTPTFLSLPDRSICLLD